MRLITTQKDTSIAINILAKAFSNSPGIAWMFEQTPRNLELFFGMLLKEAVEKKGAYLTSTKSGVLLLYDMNTKSFSLSTLLRKAYLVLFVIGINRSYQIIRINQIKRKYRPAKGYYAGALAVKQDENQWSTRVELKGEFAKLCDELGQTVYAETTNPRYFLLYKRLGFTLFHQMKHPYVDLDFYFVERGSKNQLKESKEVPTK